MHCNECGLALDGVDEHQIVKTGRLIPDIFYCPKHAIDEPKR